MKNNISNDNVEPEAYTVKHLTLQSLSRSILLLQAVKCFNIAAAVNVLC